jgi:lipopolysaccharide transport system permease protein
VISRLPTIVIEPRRGVLELGTRALWRYRELLYFMIWRDVKVRYKQTLIGAAWAILQPFLTMVVFTIVFSHFAGMPSDGVPYPIFAYTGLLPWMAFAQAVARSSESLVAEANLIRKVYFPRLLCPISGVVSPLVDFAVAFPILLAMMAWFGLRPGPRVLLLPVLLLLVLATAWAVGLWLSALNVRYRDVKHTVPFLTQFWMYASPVAYPVSVVPEEWRFLYGLNPMAGVIEGFRWALLGNATPDFAVIAASAAVLVPVLAGGLIFFTRMERSFADLI